jgi:hypothetical protein
MIKMEILILMSSNQFTKKLEKKIRRVRMKIKLMIFQTNNYYNYLIKILQKTLLNSTYQ